MWLHTILKTDIRKFLIHITENLAVTMLKMFPAFVAERRRSQLSDVG